MKRPLAGATAAGIVSIAVASGAAPALAVSEPGSAPNTITTRQAGSDPLEGYGGYAVYSYEPAEENAETGSEPSEAEGPAESDTQDSNAAESNAGVEPEAEAEAEASATVTGGVAHKPRDTTAREGEAASETAGTLPATGTPVAVLAWLGAAMVALGAALLEIAARLRYRPRHRVTRSA